MRAGPGGAENAALLAEGAARFQEALLPLDEALPTSMRVESVPPLAAGLDASGQLLPN